MKRRALVALFGAGLAVPTALWAQGAGRVYRVALLDDAHESARRPNWLLLRNRLTQLGYVEGKNVVYEARYAEGDAERLPALVAELLALKPDVLIALGTVAAQPVRKAGSTVPAVFIGVGDPVGAGLVASLARPGGNMTGTSVISSDVSPKLLELMRDLAPKAKRLALLTDLTNKSSMLMLRRVEESAKQIGVSVEGFSSRTVDELERALQAIRRGRFQGLLVGASGLMVHYRDRIIAFAAESRLPTVYARREYVDAGGLVSYGPSYRHGYVRGADYVDRILKGAKPADLPVEQPASIEMVLNLKTARALGIAIPGAIRTRADEVIE